MFKVSLASVSEPLPSPVGSAAKTLRPFHLPPLSEDHVRKCLPSIFSQTQNIWTYVSWVGS